MGTLVIKSIKRHVPDEVEEVMVFSPLDISEEMFLITFQLDQEIEVLR